MSTLFSLPYILVDVAYYKDVLVYKPSSMNETQLQNATSNHSDSLLRLPLIFVNVPHIIKFYVLYAFSSKFRDQMSRLIRLRFYLNPSVLRRLSFFQTRPGSAASGSFTQSSLFSRFNDSLRKPNRRELSSFIEPDVSTNATSNQNADMPQQPQPPHQHSHHHHSHHQQQPFSTSTVAFQAKPITKLKFYTSCLPILTNK